MFAKQSNELKLSKARPFGSAFFSPRDSDEAVGRHSKTSLRAPGNGAVRMEPMAAAVGWLVGGS